MLMLLVQGPHFEIRGLTEQAARLEESCVSTWGIANGSQPTLLFRRAAEV